MKPHERHRAEAESPLSFRIVTVSSSRFQKRLEKESFTDEGGDTAEKLVGESGHKVSRRMLVSDDKTQISGQVKDFLKSNDHVLVLAGGTGIARTDVTIEAVRPFFDKELDGFGELVRRASYDEVGAAAILTRATAGVAKGKVIVCLPGSPEAVKKALSLTLGEIPHAVFVARL